MVVLLLTFGLVFCILLLLRSRQLAEYERTQRASLEDSSLSALLDHINQAVFTCDNRGRIVATNKIAQDSLGLDVSQPAPERIFPKRIREGIIQKLEGGEEAPFETFKIHNGDSYLIRIEGRGIGSGLRFYGTVKNITEEEKARYYTERYLKQSGLVFLGSIFESLAHEIRTPCLAAEACFRMIQEDILSKLESGEEISPSDIEALNKYCRNGARTTNQISELLNHSRSFGKAYRESDLGDIEIEEACTYCKDAIEAAYNTIISGYIRIETCGNGPYIIRGHLNRFLEALGNILKNSVEAIIERSRHDPDLVPRIEILIRNEETPENPDVEQITTIEIIDNGIGFAEEHGPKIGTALFSTKSHDISYKGTGLGLTLAIQTINSIGGTWEIENIRENVNLGAKTTIKIPIPQIIRLGGPTL